MMRVAGFSLVVAVLIAATWTVPAAAEAKTCRHGMYLKSGIGPVKVERTTCRRAIRSLRRWVREGMPKPGPARWRCRQRQFGDIAPYVKVRCARRAARMRFTIGG
jgi:hypothetical protein